MKLEMRDDINLDTSDQEPGSYFNAGAQPVILRVPGIQELRQLWGEFDGELRTALKALLLMPYGQVVSELGPLGFRSSEAKDRAEVLFGMLASGSPAKSSHFRKRAMTEVAMALDLLPDRTPHGKKEAAGQARRRVD